MTQLSTPLDAMYDFAAEVHTDINEHLPVLRELGRGKTILELGVRAGCSTIAFLSGRPNLLTSIDINWTRLNPQMVVEAEAEGIPWYRFEVSSVGEDWGKVAWAPGIRFDLLFIDTLHTGDHIREELRIHAPYADRIAIHDTVTNWEHGENSQSGIGVPIMDFLANGEWVLEKEYRNNNGLMILRRKDVAPFDFGSL